MRWPTARCSALTLLLVLCACPAARASLLLSEVPKEQAYLQYRRGMLPLADPGAVADITRGLPSSLRPAIPEEAIRAMSTRDLHRLLADRQATCHGCVERRELAQRALEVRRRATEDEWIARTLTLGEDGPITNAERVASRMLAIEAAMGVRCTGAVNGTIDCGPAFQLYPPPV